ncbi:MAG: YbhN family protein [Phycisphaerales bacterium JB061]
MKVSRPIVIVCTVLMAVGIAWYVRANWESFKSVRLVDPWMVALLGALMAARMTLRGVFQWQAMRSVGAKIGLVETLKLNYAGLMLNQTMLLPVGSGYRAVYMRRVHELPYKLFASTMAALYIYFLAMSSLLGLVAIAWLGAQGAEIMPPAVAALAVIFLGCVALVAFPKLLPKSGSLAKKVDRVLEGWHAIVGSPRLIASATFVVFVSMAVSVLAMLVAFRAFAVEMDTPGALLLMSSQRVGSFIRLTPGAVGFQEMVSVYYAEMLAVTAVQAAVVLGLTRVVGMVVGLLLGIPSIWSLRNANQTPAGQEIDT